MNYDIDALKKQAGELAAESLRSGMVIGLGSGSTAFHAIRAIGTRFQSGELRDIVGIPCSEAAAAVSAPFNIPLATLNDKPHIDVTIDGADEIDPDLNLIKGLGGAHLREKIVATASEKLIIIADDRKLVDKLGTRSPVPVEVIKFAGKPVIDFLQSLGARPVLRLNDGQPFITDEGNIIYDCFFSEINDPFQLGLEIISRPGIVEHGLFLGMASEAIVATPQGIKHLKKQ